MATTHIAEYTWTSSETSKRTVADGGSVNGYFTRVNGSSTYPFNMTITGISISLGTCKVVATGGAYLKFGDNLQTVDLPYSSYSSYQTYANVGAYCTKDILTWLQDCASKQTVVRMAPHAVDSSQVQTNTIQVSSRMTMTVSITYVDGYEMQNVFKASNWSPDYAVSGQSFSVDLYGGADKALFDYVVELNLSFGNSVIRTESQTFTYSNIPTPQGVKSFPFTVPQEWSQVYSDTDIATGVVGIRGYAYDSRTIFNQQPVNDHGFGFASIVPGALVSDVRDKRISLKTGNETNAPILTKFELSALIEYYKETPVSSIVATQSSQPSQAFPGTSNSRALASGDLWMDTGNTLLKEYKNSSWSWHPFLKDYNGITLHLEATFKNNASLDRFYIHMFRRIPTKSGSADKLLTEMQQALNGANTSFEDYEQLYVYQDLDGDYTIDTIPVSGTLYLVAYAADTRGMYTAPACITIYAQEYTPPQLTVGAYRVKEATEEADSDGPRILCFTNGSWDSLPCLVSGLAPWNNAVLTCSITGHGTVFTRTYTTEASETIAESSVASTSNGFAQNATWQVQFSYTDKIVTTSRVVVIPSYSYTMHFKEGGTGIGIGMVCQNNASIEINPQWVLRRGTNPWITFIESGATKPSNMTEGCILLQAL